MWDLPRAWTRVPCIGRRILNHCATRVVQDSVSLTSLTSDSSLPHSSATPLSSGHLLLQLFAKSQLDLPAISQIIHLHMLSRVIFPNANLITLLLNYLRAPNDLGIKSKLLVMAIHHKLGLVYFSMVWLTACNSQNILDNITASGLWVHWSSWPSRTTSYYFNSPLSRLRGRVTYSMKLFPPPSAPQGEMITFTFMPPLYSKNFSHRMKHLTAVACVYIYLPNQAVSLSRAGTTSYRLYIINI